MPKVQNYPFNKRWCEDSANKIAFSNIEWQNGINYKGSIVSNQLNGVSYVLSQALQYLQCTGGYYAKTANYFKGNFVDILHVGKDHPMQRESYICIDESESGISNKPPIKDAIIDDRNGVEVYNGGVVNSAYWKRVDIGASNKIEPETVSVPERPENGKFQYLTELMRLPVIEYVEGDEPIKEVDADLWVTTYLGTKSYSVNMQIKGHYILNADKSGYNAPKDFWNMPVPNVSFGEVVWNDGQPVENAYNPKYELSYVNALTNQSINTNALYNGTITPYGFNVVVGYTTSNTGQRFWAIYLGFQEAETITMSGKSNIAVSLNNQVNDANVTICNVIPVRPFGGANAYDSLMQLVEYDNPSDTTSQIMFHYSKGEIELRAARVITNLQLGAYWILSRLQSLAMPTLKEHTARHTRAYGGDKWATDGTIYAGSKPGVLLEPGLPNITGGNVGNTIWSNLGPHGQNGAFNFFASGTWASGNDRYSGSARFDFYASRSSSIYKTSFNDTSVKSISICRFLKAF